MSTEQSYFIPRELVKDKWTGEKGQMEGRRNLGRLLRHPKNILPSTADFKIIFLFS